MKRRRAIKNRDRPLGAIVMQSWRDITQPATVPLINDHLFSLCRLTLSIETQQEPQQYPYGSSWHQSFQSVQNATKIPRNKQATQGSLGAGIKGLLVVTPMQRSRLVLPTQPLKTIHEVHGGMLTHSLPLVLLLSPRSILSGHRHTLHSVPFWGASSPHSHRILG